VPLYPGIHGRMADGVRAPRTVGATVGSPRTATDRSRWLRVLARVRRSGGPGLPNGRPCALQPVACFLVPRRRHDDVAHEVPDRSFDLSGVGGKVVVHAADDSVAAQFGEYCEVLIQVPGRDTLDRPEFLGGCDLWEGWDS